VAASQFQQELIAVDSSRIVSKADLRANALARRATITAGQRRAASERLRPALDRIGLPKAAIVSAYWPIRNEFDPRPVLDHLRAQGHRITLPVVAGPNGLIFRLWNRHGALERAGFGTYCPPEQSPEYLPDILLMPLAAFDRRGGRIGYGAGYYDRAIAKIDACKPNLRIGLAYSFQEVDQVPVDGHDKALHFVITEAETIACAAVEACA
jgi:5-formyltetrahydrofolate cyclo-ligase